MGERFHKRSVLVRELASYLLAGHNCLLTGPELLGKTPLVKQIAAAIEDGGPLVLAAE